eukprot:TRINITY_DN5723_c0_g2_i1.p1 TRINITY_DN5723_c0_g2~~TRINITY_DN5723_c0_g2_i1.p1  ORF type:complete len:188 (-),score=35.03 TRINITY_DN5723_c0_g2_i1:63-626(-)
MHDPSNEGNEREGNKRRDRMEGRLESSRLKKDERTTEARPAASMFKIENTETEKNGETTNWKTIQKWCDQLAELSAEISGTPAVAPSSHQLLHAKLLSSRLKDELDCLMSNNGKDKRQRTSTSEEAQVETETAEDSVKFQYKTKTTSVELQKHLNEERVNSDFSSTASTTPVPSLSLTSSELPRTLR